MRHAPSSTFSRNFCMKWAETQFKLRIIQISSRFEGCLKAFLIEFLKNEFIFEFSTFETISEENLVQLERSADLIRKFKVVASAQIIQISSCFEDCFKAFLIRIKTKRIINLEWIKVKCSEEIYSGWVDEGDTLQLCNYSSAPPHFTGITHFFKVI